MSPRAVRATTCDRETRTLLLVWFALCSLLVFTKADLSHVFYMFIASFVVEAVAARLARSILRKSDTCGTWSNTLVKFAFSLVVATLILRDGHDDHIMAVVVGHCLFDTWDRTSKGLCNTGVDLLEIFSNTLYQAWYLAALFKEVQVPLNIATLPVALHALVSSAASLLHSHSDSKARVNTGIGSAISLMAFLCFRLPAHAFLLLEAMAAVGYTVNLYPSLASAASLYSASRWNGEGLEGRETISAAFTFFFGLLFNAGNIVTLILILRGGGGKAMPARGTMMKNRPPAGAGARSGVQVKTVCEPVTVASVGKPDIGIKEKTADFEVASLCGEAASWLVKEEVGKGRDVAPGAVEATTMAVTAGVGSEGEVGIPPHLWKVHGIFYDLAGFVQNHPGGALAINLGRGRDCTAMFESYHPFTERNRTVLVKYAFVPPKVEGLKSGLQSIGNVGGIDAVEPLRGKKLTSSKAGLPSRGEADPFYQLLCERAEFALREVGMDPRQSPTCVKATPGRLAYYALTLVTVALTYLGYIRGSYPGSSLLFAMAAWLLGAMGHDGGHFAVAGSSAPWLDSLAGLGMSLISSPFLWMHQHTYAHHSFTNDVHCDPDLHHFTRFLRTHPLIRSAATQFGGNRSSICKDHSDSSCVCNSTGEEFVSYRMQVYRLYVYMCYTLTVLGETLWIPLNLLLTGDIYGVMPVPMPQSTRWFSSRLYGAAQVSHLLLFTLAIVVAPLVYGGGTGALMTYLALSGLLFGLFSQINHLNSASIGAARVNGMVLSVEQKEKVQRGQFGPCGDGCVSTRRTGAAAPTDAVLAARDNAGCQTATMIKTEGSGGYEIGCEGRPDGGGHHTSLISGVLSKHTETADEATVSRTLTKDSWAAEQVETSNNFCTGSWLWSLLSNGLNYQIEHHLFPGVNHQHLPLLAPVVRKTCKEHGVRYKSFPSMWAILAETASFYRELAEIKEG